MIKSYENVPTDLGPATITIDTENDTCTIFIGNEQRVWEIPISLVKILAQQIEDNEKFGGK